MHVCALLFLLGRVLIVKRLNVCSYMLPRVANNVAPDLNYGVPHPITISGSRKWKTGRPQ